MLTPTGKVAEIPAPTINGFTIPDQLEVTAGRGIGTLGQRLGILVVELAPEYSVAVMPVEGNQQPLGLVHGGAYCALGETLGSMAANMHTPAGKYAVGVDINATHTGTVTEGWVTGECRAVHLGGSLTVHEIRVQDAAGRLLSTVRITNLVRTAR